MKQKAALNDKKRKIRTQIIGKFNDISSDENKYNHCTAFI
jgi:hypothetical protein